MSNEDAAVVEPVEDEAPVETAEVDTEVEETEAEPEAEESEVEAKSEEKDEPSESSTEKEETDNFQKRIDEITKKYREQERRSLELEQQLRAQAEAQPKPEPLDPGKTLADFEYDEKAFAEYLTDFAKQSAEAEVQQKAEQEAHQRKMAVFSVKESDYANNVEDYHIVTRNPDLPINNYMVEALQSAEKGPEVLYYLGKNPDVTRGLSMMAPLDMARELGRIEAVELAKPEKAVKDPVPPPPPKIKPTASPERVTPDSEASDKLSDREWLRRRNKQLAAKGR